MDNNTAQKTKGLNVFEKYLPIWVILCIVAGIALGKFAPSVATYWQSTSTRHL
jgi:ACR3 family arsenite transporter